MTKPTTRNGRTPPPVTRPPCAADPADPAEAIESLLGSTPGDALETMLAAQMIACHGAAMTCYERAAGADEHLASRMAHLNLGARLGRTFTDLTHALNKHRGRADQKVTVEHVHVDAAVEAGTKLMEQPPAKAKRLGNAEERRVRGQNPRRGALPVPGDS